MNGYTGERPEWAKSAPDIHQRPQTPTHGTPPTPAYGTPQTPSHIPSARGDPGGQSFRPVSARKDHLNQVNSTMAVRPSPEVSVRPTVSLDASVRPAPVVKMTLVKTVPKRSARDPPCKSNIKNKINHKFYFSLLVLKFCTKSHNSRYENLKLSYVFLVVILDKS